VGADADGDGGVADASACWWFSRIQVLKKSRTPVTDSHIARNVPAKWDKRLVISASFIQPHDHYSIKIAVVCQQTPVLNYQIMVNLAKVRQHLK
jgi:hypothetical protein